MQPQWLRSAEIRRQRTLFGVGEGTNIDQAAVRAIVAGLNRWATRRKCKILTWRKSVYVLSRGAIPCFKTNPPFDEMESVLPEWHDPLPTTTNHSFRWDITGLLSAAMPSAVVDTEVTVEA